MHTHDIRNSVVRHIRQILPSNVKYSMSVNLLSISQTTWETTHLLRRSDTACEGRWMFSSSSMPPCFAASTTGPSRNKKVGMEALETGASSTAHVDAKPCVKRGQAVAVRGE